MIPRVIYQTWRTKDETSWTAAERRWMRTWRANTGWRHELHDDDDCLRLVTRHYPDARAAYHSLSPVEKADLWRYMILHYSGGVYTDFDTACRVPLDRWPLEAFVHSTPTPWLSRCCADRRRPAGMPHRRAVTPSTPSSSQKRSASAT